MSEREDRTRMTLSFDDLNDIEDALHFYVSVCDDAYGDNLLRICERITKARRKMEGKIWLTTSG